VIPNDRYLKFYIHVQRILVAQEKQTNASFITKSIQRIEYNGNNPCTILDYANENELWIVMSETVLLCTAKVVKLMHYLQHEAIVIS